MYLDKASSIKKAHWKEAQVMCTLKEKILDTHFTPRYVDVYINVQPLAMLFLFIFSLIFFGGFIFLNQPHFVISIKQIERTVVACSVVNLFIENFSFFPQNAC